VTVDRTHRQDELLGDLAVGLALRQQRQHLKLPVGQAKRLRVAEWVDVNGIPPTEIRSERIHRRLASLDWPHV
jgi:hypothetical protein